MTAFLRAILLALLGLLACACSSKSALRRDSARQGSPEPSRPEYLQGDFDCDGPMVFRLTITPDGRSRMVLVGRRRESEFVPYTEERCSEASVTFRDRTLFFTDSRPCDDDSQECIVTGNAKFPVGRADARGFVLFGGSTVCKRR